MTYITEVHAPALGRPTQHSLSGLSPQLNIVYGPNGSGKSTLRDAIFFTLYGIPTARDGRSKKLTPTAGLRRTYGSSGASRHVSLTLSSDGGVLVLDRQESSGSKHEGPPAIVQGSLGDYLSLVGSVSKDHYAAIWMSSQTLLSEVDPSGNEGGAVLALLAQQYQTLADPESAASKITTSQKRFRANVTGLKALGKRLTSLRDNLSASRAEAREHSRLSGEIESLSSQLVETDAALGDATSQQQRLIELRDSLAEAARDRSGLHDSLRENEIRLERLTGEDDSRSEFEPALLEARAAIIRQAGRRESIQATRTSIGQLQNRITELEARLAPLNNLPPFASDHHIAAAEGKLAAPAERYRAAQTRLLEAQHELAGDDAVSAVRPQRVQSALVGGGAAFVLSAALATYLTGGLSPLVLVLAGALGAAIGALLWLLAAPVRASNSGHGNPADSDTVSRATAIVSAALDSWRLTVQSIPELTDAPDLDPDSTPGVLAATRARLVLVSELEEAQRALASHESAVREWETAVLDLDLTVYGKRDELTARSADDLIEALANAAEAAHTASLTAAARSDRVRELMLESQTIKQRIAELDTKIAQVASALGVNAADSADHLARSIENLEAHVVSLHEEKSRAAEQRGSLLAEQRRYEGDATVEMLEAEVEGLSTEVVALAREYAVTEAAKALILTARDQYEQESTPSILERSSEVLNTLTAGALSAIHLPVVNDVRELTVSGLKGTSLTIRELSDGERDQLYLAFRVGVLLALDDVGPSLPVLLDDVILSYDSDRRERACQVIAKLAEHRQVFFFTCQQQLKSALERHGAEANVETCSIELGVE